MHVSKRFQVILRGLYHASDKLDFLHLSLVRIISAPVISFLHYLFLDGLWTNLGHKIN